MNWKEALKFAKKLKNKKGEASDKDTKKEDKLSEENLLARMKRKVKTVVNLALTWVGAQVTAIAALFGSILAIILAVALLLTTLLGALSGILSTNGGIGWFGDGQGVTDYVAGDRYVFNMTDYNRLGTPYLKNLYIHAWLCENIKDLTGAKVSVAQMVGIPTLENGSSYFTMACGSRSTKIDGKYPEELSIAEYASGMTSRKGKYRGIYQHYLYEGNETFGDKVQGIFKKYGFTEKDMWTNISIHKDPLSTATYDCSGRSNDVNSYCNKDVMQSPYNIAALILATVSNTTYVDSYMRKDLTSSNYQSGHIFGSSYKKALQHYGLKDDEDVFAYVSNTAYYSIHAGGAWGWFDNNYSGYEAYIDAQIDYLVFCYKNFRGMRLKSEYLTEEYVTTMDSYAIRRMGMGDANSNYAAIKPGEYVSCDPTSLGIYELNGKTLEMSLRGAWETQMKSEGKNSYISAIKIASESYGGDGPGSYCSYKQNSYAFACGPAIEAAGQAKIDLLASKLGYKFVTDNRTGHICHAESSSNGGGSSVYNSDIPPTGHYDWGSKTFENSLVEYTDSNGVTRKLSNVRNDEWFVKLDEDEWTHPLDVDPSHTATGGVCVTSRFGYRYYNSRLEFHGGMDLNYNVKYDTVAEWRKYCPIYAMHDGELTQVRNYTSGSNGTGRCVTYKVTYKRDGKSITRYITCMHMSAIDANLKEGDKIKKGQLLGYMGGSGDSETSYGRHMHIQLGTGPKTNGRYGLVDIETEIPFLTLYSDYGSWSTNPSNMNDDGVSGFLLHQQQWDLKNSQDYDPQSLANYDSNGNNIVNAPKS